MPDGRVNVIPLLDVRKRLVRDKILVWLEPVMTDPERREHLADRAAEWVLSDEPTRPPARKVRREDGRH
jgi:hypothetical protein